MARNKYNVDEELYSPFTASQLKRALKYVLKYKSRMAMAFVAGILSSLAAMITPLLQKNIIDVKIPDKDVRGIIVFAFFFIGVVVVSILLSTLRDIILSKTSQRIIVDMRADLYKHIQKLSFDYFDSRPHGKILVRVVNYVNEVANFLTSGLLSFVMELLTIIALLCFMFSVNATLSIVILSGLPFLFLTVMLLKKTQHKGWLDHNNKSSNLNSYTNENVNGVKILQAYAREDVNNEIFAELALKAKKSWMHVIKYVLMLPATTNFLSQVVYCLIFIVGVFVVKDISLGTLLSMAGYAAMFWRPINNISNIYNSLMTTGSYLERIFDTLDEKITIDDSENAEILPQIEGNVEFKNVTFAYEETNILENLSFTAEKGKSYAFVGPTGAGKTTIVNLLARFYDIQQGQILIDGHDISKVTLNSLRSQMGIMLQDSFIFTGTIRENICYGKKNATDSEIIAACKAVQADEFIEKMPDGYDSFVGERGNLLSAGQRQLLSFARTLVADPKILILDEATSSIDAKTEDALQKGIKTLLQNRTSFIIAHRLSTIKNCDKIMYINDKGIVESGNLEELMAKKGAYYELYTSQLKD